MRLFVAINFNNNTRRRLAALCGQLRSSAKSGNFSLLENLHLTLAFLGECSAKQTDIAKKIINATTFEPFDIEIDCVGKFKREGGDIWWAGLSKNKALLSVHCDLTDRLRSSGFALENRPFGPHITIARKVKTNIIPWEFEPFGETVKKIDLMKSERINGKLTYTAIAGSRL